jgi:4-alpha-glucanotransferase
MHPTSLPGEHGIGYLGSAAYQFVDLLASLKQTLWQVLPLSPVLEGNSPYQSPSAFAGNPLLINLNLLQQEGWLHPDKIRKVPNFSVDFVDSRDFRKTCRKHKGLILITGVNLRQFG